MPWRGISKWFPHNLLNGLDKITLKVKVEIVEEIKYDSNQQEIYHISQKLASTLLFLHFPNLIKPFVHRGQWRAR